MENVMERTIDADFMYGIADAIKKLRPKAKFEIYNTTFTKWDDPDGLEAPSWDEIFKIVEEDEAEYKKLEYARSRKAAYKFSLGTELEQLDMLWHMVESGEDISKSEWFSKIKEIKERYPKP
jgi:hypothetical protein